MRSIYFFCVIVACFLASGCYEPQKGCLDIKASNYNLEADQSCDDDCCVYPNLKLSFDAQYVDADTSHHISFGNTLLRDVNNRPFYLKEIRYFISNLELVNPQGESLRINEEVKIVLKDGNQLTTIDDYLVIRGSRTSAYTPGTLISEGAFAGLRFTVGFPEQIQLTDIDNMSSTHPLGWTSDSMYQDNHYLLSKIEYYSDTTDIANQTPQSLHINIDKSPIVLELPFSEDVLYKEGLDFQINISTNVSSWFAQCDITEEPSAIISNLMEALPSSFYIESIQQ